MALAALVGTSVGASAVRAQPAPPDPPAATGDTSDTVDAGDTIDVVLAADGTDLDVLGIVPSAARPDAAGDSGSGGGDPAADVRQTTLAPAVVVDDAGRFSIVGAVIDDTPVLFDTLDPNGRLVSDVVEPPTRNVTVSLPSDVQPERITVQLAPATFATAVVESPGVTGDVVIGDGADGQTADGGDGNGDVPVVTAFPATTIHQGGPADAALDIVFLGDGYTVDELDDFAADARAATDALLAEVPFDGLRQYVNVHRVDVPSNESGTDDVCNDEYVDTAFDTGFNPTGIDCRLLWSANTAAVDAAAAFAPDVDTVAVLVNTDRYGGAATPGGVAFTTTGGAGEQVFVHEFGHSFGFLGDEYSGVGVGPDYLADFPNLTVDLSAGLDWADWVHPATPIPTSAPINGVVGAYQGGGGWGVGVYRPTFDSKMRSLYRPFEAVNAELLARRLLTFAPADVTPPAIDAAIISRLDTEVGVRVEYADPQSAIAGAAASSSPTFDDTALVAADFVTEGAMELTIPIVDGVTPDVVHVRARNGAGAESTLEVPVFATPAPAGVVDVAIGSVYAEPVAGDTSVVFRVVLRNRGSAPTPGGVAHVVDLVVDGTRVQRFDAHAEPLAPGGSIELVTPPISFAPGSHAVTAIADPDDLIPHERRMRNNSRTARFAVVS